MTPPTRSARVLAYLVNRMREASFVRGLLLVAASAAQLYRGELTVADIVRDPLAAGDQLFFLVTFVIGAIEAAFPDSFGRRPPEGPP